MNYLILLIFLFTLSTYSKDYNFDSRGYSEQKIIKFHDGSQYIHFESIGWWTDSRGNFGTEKCYGKTEIANSEINLDILCELIDQSNDVLKVSRKRNSLVGGGVGINTYLETTVKYNDLLNKTCTYAVTFLNKDFFYKQKCKMN